MQNLYVESKRSKMESAFEFLLEFIGTVFGLQGTRLRIVICGFMVTGVLLFGYLMWS